MAHELRNGSTGTQLRNGSTGTPQSGHLEKCFRGPGSNKTVMFLKIDNCALCLVEHISGT